MKKLIDKIGLETFWGGIFAVITAAAIITEVAMANFEPAAIAGGVKDLFGTLITIVMLIVAVRALTREKPETLSFEDRMTDALNSWIKNHSNMIVKTSKLPQGHENDFGMSMTTDINRFYNSELLKSDGGKGVGRFFRITKIDRKTYESNDVQVIFFLNSQTYCVSNESNDKLTELMSVASNLSMYIQGVIEGINVGAVRKDNNDTVMIPITFKEPIVTDEHEDIDKVINLIDRMYEAMLVSARRK